MTDTIALQRQIKELRAQVADLTLERDIALVDRQAAVTQLTHAYDLQHTDDVPAELVHALRSASAQTLQGVWVTTRDRDLHVLVDGAAYTADPGTEGRVWAWLTCHADQPPPHPFERLDMPDRLYGVAWPDGQIAVSLALSGQDVIAAYRALRPRRQRSLVRAVGLLAIPGAGGGRAALAMLRDVQAAASAATSAATSAAAAAAGSTLPAVTAAAISCTAVTSCTAPISIDISTRPAAILAVERPAQATLVEPPEPMPGKRGSPDASEENEDAEATEGGQLDTPPQAERAPDPGPAEPTSEPTSEDEPVTDGSPAGDPQSSATAHPEAAEEPASPTTDPAGNQPPAGEQAEGTQHRNPPRLGRASQQTTGACWTTRSRPPKPPLQPRARRRSTPPPAATEPSPSKALVYFL
ncbi:hypothetical protein LUX33_01005 [Actinomadura madurae]|uniref:hypothetical protein n=1 Tax=Actinomadura madurae TaxID=1993 RepID=UPI0020D1F5D9|nr:hypothetical protein [Actinomadura madurae]MCP9947172.1 hypothetical protein [Actinomadura madurae]